MSLKVRNFATLSSVRSGFAGHPGAVYNLTFLLKHCEACTNAKYTSDQLLGHYAMKWSVAPFPRWFLFCFLYLCAWFCLCMFGEGCYESRLVEHMYTLLCLSLRAPGRAHFCPRQGHAVGSMPQ